MHHVPQPQEATYGSAPNLIECEFSSPVLLSGLQRTTIPAGRKDEPCPLLSQHLIGADAVQVKADTGVRYLYLPGRVGRNFVGDHSAILR